MMEEDDDDALITMTTALAFSVRLIKATTHFAHKISIKHLQGMHELHYYFYTINRRLAKSMAILLQIPNIKYRFFLVSILS
jgi:hypothetical protein